MYRKEGKHRLISPWPSRIRHAVPVVAAVDTGEENSTIEPSVDKQQEDTETSGTHDDSEKHSNDKDNETVAAYLRNPLQRQSQKRSH